MSDWKPKVGEKVTYPSGQGVLIIDEPDSNDVVIVKDEQGEYRRVSVFNIKPLPTEEEKLIDDLLPLLNGITVGFDTIKPSEEAERIIKAGYRKVEPISRDELVNLLYSKSGVDIFDYLVKNNHIVVKGE